MEWLNNLLISLSDYPIIISFLAGLISGETVILALPFYQEIDFFRYG